jgi:uncharacterized radical SAM superfamily Fe-S cluster-containing enzyme
MGEAMTPTISICIPLRVTDSYRRINWLVCCAELQKIVARRPDVEIVVAEWDGTHAVDCEHVKRVEGIGQFTRSRARNAALAAATGEMICFLDSDMIMTTDAWEESIETAKRYDCYSPFTKFKRLGKLKTQNRINQDHTFNWALPVNNDIGGSLAQLKGNLTGGIFICKRSFIESVNGWDERFKGWGYEDIALCKHAERGGYKVGWGLHQALHLFHPKDRKGREQTLKVLHRHYSEDLMKFPISLEKIDYHLVDACNLSCRFCTHYSNFKQPLNAVTLEQASQEWATWSKLIRPNHFLLLGGEPTLNKNLSELTDLAAEIWVRSQIVIFTNGGFWEKHPGIEQVLKRIGGKVYCSLHHSDPAKNQAIREKFTATLDAGVKVQFAEISRSWRAFYQLGSDGKPAPYESDTAQAWKICSSKFCTVLRNNQLWKCAQVAFSDSLKTESFPEFSNYVACDPTREAVLDFFSRRAGPESCCSHCPSRVTIVPGGEGM